MPRLHILSVGMDHHLMAVRSMLLRHAGYQVTETFTSSEAMQQLQSDAVDMMLICHTVPRREQEQLIAEAHEKRRLLPVICITARDTDAVTKCVNVENSPAALLEAIRTSAIGVTK